MRCKIKDEGRAHKTWQYILEFDEPFEEKRFIRNFNEAILGIPEYDDFLLDYEDGHCYLVNDFVGKKVKYAEFSFTKRKELREAIVCVKRLGMTRERLHEFLEEIIGNIFNPTQSKSQPCHRERLDLFRPEK